MKKITLMIIPEGTRQMRQVQVHTIWLQLAWILFITFSGFVGYFSLDYMQLLEMRKTHQTLIAENESMKGEAKILLNHLDDVKRSLGRINDYSTKLSEMTKLTVKNFSKKTGIGPLSQEEYTAHLKNADPKAQALLGAKDPNAYTNRLPLGVDIERLSFRTVFSGLQSLESDADRQAVELQFLLSNLGKQKSLLSSIPSIKPVNGWTTSGFGPRVSPFTGRKTMHKGIDVASPVGTPIVAPGDGVVIFTGRKSGFGNFIMIAHGYGIISRYGHIAQSLVSPGQKVTRGQQIATVGMTGRTTGPHLHYEILANGSAINPRKFILDDDIYL